MVCCYVRTNRHTMACGLANKSTVVRHIILTLISAGCLTVVSHLITIGLIFFSVKWGIRLVGIQSQSSIDSVEASFWFWEHQKVFAIPRTTECLRKRGPRLVKQLTLCVIKAELDLNSQDAWLLSRDTFYSIMKLTILSRGDLPCYQHENTPE